MSVRSNYVLAALGIACITVTQVQASNCPMGGSTVVYVNGVNVDFDGAYDSAAMLEQKVRPRLSLPECVAFRFAYNDTQGFIGDFIQSIIQKGIEVAEEQVHRWLVGLDLAPNWFRDEVEPLIRRLDEVTYVSSTPLQNTVGVALNEINSCNKAILVAHSQGNFYANQAFRILTEVFPPGSITSDSVSVIGVATPASRVAGDPTNQRYTTVRGDIITAVPLNLRWNVTKPGCPRIPFLPNSLRCHSFVGSYLEVLIPGGPTVSRITDHIQNEVASQSICPVLTVTKSGAGTGTVTSAINNTVFPARRDIDCGDTCAAPLPAGATLELTATEDIGSVFGEWTVDCADGSPTTFVTMGEDDKTCDARFDLAKPFTVTPMPGTSATFPPGTTLSNPPFTSQTGDPAGPFHNQSVWFRGFLAGGSGESNSSGGHLVYRVQIQFDQDVSVDAITVAGVGDHVSCGNGPTLRLLDQNGAVLGALPTAGLPSGPLNMYTLSLNAATARTFFVDEFDCSTNGRYRDHIEIAYHK